MKEEAQSKRGKVVSIRATSSAPPDTPLQLDPVERIVLTICYACRSALLIDQFNGRDTPPRVAPFRRLTCRACSAISTYRKHEMCVVEGHALRWLPPRSHRCPQNGLDTLSWDSISPDVQREDGAMCCRLLPCRAGLENCQ